MSLTSGARVGPYEIVATLGEGGMWEVYRAIDTKLTRQAGDSRPATRSLT